MPIPDTLSYPAAACAEPLAVTLHAVARAGSLLGRRVLITGAGPIGILSAAAVRLAGAAEIVITDLFDGPLAVAERMGATQVVNVKTGAAELESFMQEGGYFDAAIEASGNIRGLENCIDATRSGGRIVQVGIFSAGNPGTPINKLLAKELELVGTFRFHEEFQWAVQALTSGRVKVDPILSAQFTFRDAIQAFELASDRSKAVKVSLIA
jgi:L-idonate 5-dehydrogenase